MWKKMEPAVAHMSMRVLYQARHSYKDKFFMQKFNDLLADSMSSNEASRGFPKMNDMTLPF
jgi:hypothetical protein